MRWTRTLVLAVLAFTGAASLALAGGKAEPQASGPAGAAIPAGNVKGGQYLEYSAGTYEAAAPFARVLFFHATWCPTCKAADRAFQDKIAELPADVVVLKTDYDSEIALKKTYSITYQHTFVLVDKDGKALATWSGGDTAELVKRVAAVRGGG